MQEKRFSFRLLVFFIFMIILVLCGLQLRSVTPVLLQEGSPIALGIAVLRLELTGKDIVRVTDEPHTKYLVRTKAGHQPFIERMEHNGWHLYEQAGGGLQFRKGEEVALAAERNWTRRYIIILSEVPLSE